MKHLVTIVVSVLISLPINAGEGMWLLPYLKQQNETTLKEMGLKLEVNDIYSPDSVSIKDGVVIFGRGCTGEAVSNEGLILTNHHCGYEWIQKHSSVKHDYLIDGFWARSKEEELPTPGLEVRFINSIEEVTDSVKTAVERSGKPMNAFDTKFLKKLATRLTKNDSIKNSGFTEVVIKPFYGGNRFFMFTQTVYKDVRFVGAPPSSIGKFGYDTDNWMWPRHTGDFSLFRVYTDTLGNPALYDKSNIPLNPKHFFKISLEGVDKGDFTMVMGFPGTTNRYDISEEIIQYRDIINTARIEMRGTRLNVLEALMLADPKVRIQYASKYSGASNYWKNAKGMNKGIKKLGVIEEKRKAEELYKKWATDNNKTEFATALDSMKSALRKIFDLKYQYYMLYEGVSNGMEFSKLPAADSLIMALENNRVKDSATVSQINKFKNRYLKFANKDYNTEVDKKVSKEMIKKYMSIIPAENRPDIFSLIDKKYDGDTDKFIEEAFEKSIFADSVKFGNFIKNPTIKKIKNDIMYKFATSVRAKSAELKTAMRPHTDSLAKAKQVYIEGILAKQGEQPIYPDANFTIRLSYGKVLPYAPADAVIYDYFTTLKGVMEKEDSTDYEFVVSPKLKEIYNNHDYGRYADKNGDMRVCFISTNDITGGNSGSPVINGQGELVGLAFDGNWEAMSGDIIFEPAMQRTICVDIRYVLMVIDKFAGAENIIKELVIAE